MNSQSAAMLLLLNSACAIGASSSYPINGSARAATDTPAQFVTQSGEVGAGSSVPPGCLSPMVDPRDGTRLTLARSEDGIGDYAVPAGRYGTGPTELLRLDCGSGKVIGIVPRSR